MGQKVQFGLPDVSSKKQNKNDDYDDFCELKMLFKYVVYMCIFC